MVLLLLLLLLLMLLLLKSNIGHLLDQLQVLSRKPKDCNLALFCTATTSILFASKWRASRSCPIDRHTCILMCFITAEEDCINHVVPATTWFCVRPVRARDTVMTADIHTKYDTPCSVANQYWPRIHEGFWKLRAIVPSDLPLRCGCGVAENAIALHETDWVLSFQMHMYIYKYYIRMCDHCIFDAI